MMSGTEREMAAKAAAAARKQARKATAERRRLGDVAAETGATRERAAKAAKGAASWRGRREGTARIGAALPRAVRDLFDRGQLDAVHVRAAEMYAHDYHFGMCPPGMTQRWERGVDGGGRGDEAEARLDARQRFVAYDGGLGPVRAVVFGVLLGGVTLEAAEGPGRFYAHGAAKRAGNAAALYLGLDMLARCYELKPAG